MRKVEVRSNIAGDIVKIRKGVVFKEYATVIDELLQNCQRAKAKNIRIEVLDNRLVIEDDGVGCADPQALFEKNTSAWMDEDEAFGEGFFSVFLLADRLKVRSHDWELKVDVLDMLATKNMFIDVVDGLEFHDGFKVEIEGDTVANRNWELKHEVRQIAPIMAQKVVMNDDELEKIDLISKTSPNDVLVDNELFSAVLTPATGYSTIQYYYEDRPVREDYVNGAKGKVMIKKGKVTLKAPDRKEFIYDDKLRALVDKVTQEVRNMYREFIQTATDEELDQFETPINEYLEVEEYARVLAVSEKLFKAKDDEEVVDQEEGSNEVPKWVDLPDLFEAIKNIEKVNTTYELEGTARARRPEGMLERLFKKHKKVLYVPTGEVETYEKDIREAEYSGFSIVYAKNRLYEKAFAFYGVSSIADFDKLIEEEYVIEKAEPRSKKELRFLALMKRVEQFYGMKENSIKLANLDKIMKLKETGEVMSTEGEEVHGLCDRLNGLVYIDRDIVKFPEYRAQEPDYPTVTSHDYRVLLRVQQTLAHELAHLLYGFADNTLEHSQAMAKIGYELAELF
jgi:hypothetical protein